MRKSIAQRFMRSEQPPAARISEVSRRSASEAPVSTTTVKAQHCKDEAGSPRGASATAEVGGTIPFSRGTPPQASRSATDGGAEPPPGMGLGRGPRHPGGNGLRYQLATLARVLDNLVTSGVRAYDSLFALEPRDQAEIHLRLGKEAAQQGDLREAFAALRRSAQIRPDNGEVHFQLGRLYLQRRKAPEAALQAFERARKAGYVHRDLELGIAEALTELGRDQEAAAALQTALDKSPSSAEVAYLLGLALDRLGNHAEAVHAFERAISLAPQEVTYHQSLGLTLESSGRRKEAIECYKRALQLERRRDLAN